MTATRMPARFLAFALNYVKRTHPRKDLHGDWTVGFRLSY
jgi:hypothetical protein